MLAMQPQWTWNLNPHLHTEDDGLISARKTAGGHLNPHLHTEDDLSIKIRFSTSSDLNPHLHTEDDRNIYYSTQFFSIYYVFLFHHSKLLGNNYYNSLFFTCFSVRIP